MTSYKDIILLLNSQMQEVIDENSELQDFKFSLVNEQDYMNLREIENDKTYIVIRFAQGNETFAYTTIPLTLLALGQANEIEKTQLLLTAFVLKYNLKRNDELKITQNYNTPSVVSNFNLVNRGLRSLFSLGGVIVYSKNANYIDEIYFDDEKIEFISTQYGYNANIEPNAFWTSDITKSFAKQGTITIGIIAFLLDSKYLNEVLQVSTKNKSIDTKFKISIKFKNGIVLNDIEMILFNSSIDQKLVDTPVISMTFTG